MKKIFPILFSFQKIPRAVGVMMLALGAARAEWSFSGGVESFNWKEHTSPQVTEKGPLYTFGFSWMQIIERGIHAAYDGQLYGGRVDYKGAFLFSGGPLNSKTDINGLRNEFHLIYRQPLETVALSFNGGLGWDFWNRDLGKGQEEDFSVLYLKTGVEVGPKIGRGFSAGGGVKFPFSIREDAHLTNIGFNRNPILKPGKNPSIYARVKYRFSGPFRLTAYYDGFKLGESQKEFVTSAFFGSGYVYQPKSDLDIFGLKLEYIFNY